MDGPEEALPIRLMQDDAPQVSMRPGGDASILDEIMGNEEDHTLGLDEDLQEPQEAKPGPLEEQYLLAATAARSSGTTARPAVEAADAELAARGAPPGPGDGTAPTAQPERNRAESEGRGSGASWGGSPLGGAAGRPAGAGTRYFIIKSLDHHNIAKSIENGIWATQQMNERLLNEAFETSERVILIFSVNMSGHFQGYARMVSPIGRQRADVWNGGEKGANPWGGSFQVEWLSLHDLPFHQTLQLKNPLNSYKPVKISRDGQELTADVGEQLCELIDDGATGGEAPKRKVAGAPASWGRAVLDSTMKRPRGRYMAPLPPDGGVPEYYPQQPLAPAYWSGAPGGKGLYPRHNPVQAGLPLGPPKRLAGRLGPPVGPSAYDGAAFGAAAMDVLVAQPGVRPGEAGSAAARAGRSEYSMGDEGMAASRRGAAKQAGRAGGDGGALPSRRLPVPEEELLNMTYEEYLKKTSRLARSRQAEAYSAYTYGNAYDMGGGGDMHDWSPSFDYRGHVSSGEYMQVYREAYGGPSGNMIEGGNGAGVFY